VHHAAANDFQPFAFAALGFVTAPEEIKKAGPTIEE
jgi:hypothetical protein